MRMQGLLLLVVMAVLLVAASVAAADSPVVEGYNVNGSTTASESLVLDKPTGVQVGELLLLIVGNDDGDNGAEFTDNLAGWNYIGTSGDKSNAAADIGAFWRIADGTEGTTVTVTATSDDDWFGWYIRISGADSTNPINASNFALSSPEINHYVPEVTTGVDDCLAICALSFDGGDGYPFSVFGTDWTETAEYQTASGGNDVSACWGTKEQALAGTTGDAMVSCSISDGAAYFQLAIAPVAADTIAPTYTNDGDNSTGSVTEGDIVNTHVYWADVYDGNSLNKAVLRTNKTGEWTNESWHTFTGDPEWANITFDTTGHAGKTICWVQWANDTSNNWNTSMSTTVHCFTVISAADETPPTWQNQGQNNSAPAEGEAVLLYAQGKDETALDFAILETNETGGWLNITDGSYSSPKDMGDATDWTWSNFTWQNTSINAGTTVGWRIWYNDTSNNWNKADIMTFTVQDTQAPLWSDLYKNKTTIYQNDSVKFTANWTDDVALSGYKFSTNQTGSWENSSLVSFSGTSDISESTMQITVTAGTTIGWRFYAKDTSDNWNATDIQSFVVSLPAPPLSSPYMIYGWVFYENQTACNNPVVNITNLNSNTLWQAETNANYNYYQIILANGTDLNASEILQFNVKAPDGSQVNTTSHIITQSEIENGGLFDFNITLEPPVTPFVIYGWVNYTNGAACDNPTVDITNTNTGMQWQAETHSGNSYYQLVLDTTSISTGDVLQFNVTDGTKSNSTNHTVIAGDINSGGIFDFNLTLLSGSQTDGPTVDSITITPDEYGSTPGVQIDPNPGGAKTVTVSVVVIDPNGYGDISTVNITDITPDPALGDPSPVTLEYQSGSGIGNSATYNGTFDMQFYDQPLEYTVTVTAKDTIGTSDTNSSTFNYTSCNAMSLDSGTIAFGSIDPGENNTVAGDKNMSTTSSPTIRNTGNVVIDVNITGSNMTSGGDMITKDQMDAQVDTLGYSNLSVARCFDANIAAGASSLENVDFRLNVPYGTPTGSYNGSVTLTVDTCG